MFHRHFLPRHSTRRALLAASAAVLVLLTGVASAASAGGDADAGLGQLLQLMARRQHAHAAFVERQFIAILDRPLESSGELIYDAPDRLEKRVLRPKPASLILDKGTLSIRRGGHSYALALRDYPEIGPFIESILATLAGDLPALDATYTSTFTSSAGEWTLVLVPHAGKLAAIVARIRLSGSGDTIREVVVQRSDGDCSVMTIRALSGP